MLAASPNQISRRVSSRIPQSLSQNTSSHTLKSDLPSSENPPQPAHPFQNLPYSQPASGTERGRRLNAGRGMRSSASTQRRAGRGRGRGNSGRGREGNQRSRGRKRRLGLGTRSSRNIKKRDRLVPQVQSQPLSRSESLPQSQSHLHMPLSRSKSFQKDFKSINQLSSLPSRTVERNTQNRLQKRSEIQLERSTIPGVSSITLNPNLRDRGEQEVHQRYAHQSMVRNVLDSSLNMSSSGQSAFSEFDDADLLDLSLDEPIDS